LGVRFNHITEVVKGILTEDPKARDSDNYLYVKVCEKINPEAMMMNFKYVTLNTSTLGLPNRETVRRTRQKVQEIHPELKSSDEVDAVKFLHEQDYKAYAQRMFV